MLFSYAPPRRLLAAILALAAVLLTATAVLRSTEYDENYTVFLAAGTPRPEWPAGVFAAGTMRGIFAGHSTPASIATDLRHTDVHPPLYFWAAAGWRALAGTGLLETRMLSVLFAVAALAVLGMLARSAQVPPAAAMLLCLGTYGFTYTGAIARGFALAQLLLLAGTLLLLRARGPRAGFGAGLALGAATFTNYLTAFAAAAALAWRLLARWRAWAVWLAAGIGFVLLIGADLFFFLAQRDSRTGQFPPFALLPSLMRLAQYGIAALFGGLPLYVDGIVRAVVGAAVTGLLALLAGIVAWRWSRIGTREGRWLLLMSLAATPCGLLALGFAFNNTPIELRYLAFAAPFAAILAAGGLATLSWRGPLIAATFALQAASLAGMMLHPATMQPPRATAREAARLVGPDGLVLIPFGNDGVGVPAPFVTESPDWLRLRIVRRDEDLARVLNDAAAFRRAVVALIEVDADSRATTPPLLAAFDTAACWRRAETGTRAVAFDRTC